MKEYVSAIASYKEGLGKVQRPTSPVSLSRSIRPGSDSGSSAGHERREDMARMKKALSDGLERAMDAKREPYSHPTTPPLLTQLRVRNPRGRYRP